MLELGAKTFAVSDCGGVDFVECGKIGEEEEH